MRFETKIGFAGVINPTNVEFVDQGRDGVRTVRGGRALGLEEREEEVGMAVGARVARVGRDLLGKEVGNHF